MAMTPNVIAGDSPGNFIGTPGGENLYQPPSAGLQPGGSNMTPAPWQLPSGGATTPQAAFQNDFATAQDFRDRAIASGMDPQEADATYLAPLKAKWKTISAAPELFQDNNKFLQFNSEFSKATDNFNSEIQSGRSPKAAAEISLMPVLQKWTLNPGNKEPFKDVPKLFQQSLDVAGKADSKVTDIPNLSVLPATDRNFVLSYYGRTHPRVSTGSTNPMDEYINKALQSGNASSPQLMPGTPSWMNIPKQADTLSEPQKVTTKYQFDKLQKGEIYIGTDGKKYRKP